MIITTDTNSNGLTSERAKNFEIVIVAKGKHAALYRAAQKVGGQSALARLLNVTPTMVGRWVNLQDMPRFEPSEDKNGRQHESRWCDADERRALEQKLFELTGELLDDLFPKAIRDNREFLKTVKTQEFYTTVDLLRLASDAAERLRLPDPSVVLQQTERVEMLMDVMATRLNHREQLVVKMRYGLDDETPQTYEALSKRFRICAQRVQQIERTALRKLAHYAPQCLAEPPP